MNTQKTHNESMNQKPCGCNDFEYCEIHNPLQVRIAALQMGKITIGELGSVRKAIDFHTTQCRVHFEILAALCSYDKEVSQ